ncbi:MAG: VCBS repeat-containing protein [Bacteroidales bacterium]|nr:VCBS repeat-containing protein [Bacteroidales bacterium]
MYSKLKIVILFLLLSQVMFARVNSRWIPLKTPTKITQIIGGKSINNFWLMDEHNSILHFVNNQWKTFHLGSLVLDQNYRLIRPVVIDSNRILVLIIDLKWKTHLVEIAHNTIIHHDLVAPYPLYQITQVDQSLYATGNFGVIYQYKNGRWRKLNGPIQSHIHSTAVDKKHHILWLGTNSEGLFSWDGKQFKNYRIPKDDNKSVLAEILIINDTLFINTGNNRSYFLNSSALEPISNEQAPFFTPLKLTHDGYFQIKTSQQNVFHVPYSIKMSSYAQLDDGHVLLLNQSNQLYSEYRYNGNFFNDFAAVSGIEGPRFNFTSSSISQGVPISSLYRKLRPSIVISDFNMDEFPDILLFNISDVRRPYFYLNTPENYFTDFALPYGLNANTYNSFFTYAYDLDGDNLPEIISADFKNNQYYLNVFKKTAGKYSISYSYLIPKKFSTNPTQGINFSDFDLDGDLDIALVYGYSNQGQGTLSFLLNNGYGSFTPSDTSQHSTFEGWNVKTIFADFNNDGFTDIFILRNWANDALYFKNPLAPSGWDQRPLPLAAGAPIQQRKISAAALDYDNDGDLDILRLAEMPFISLYENDGKGNFKDVTLQTGLNTLNSERKTGQFTVGDYDNNGFMDLFITSNERKGPQNHIFLNHKGRFTDRSVEMGITRGTISFAATCDLDNDGDLDIYGFNEGKNIYWKNNLDKPNFIQLKLRGVKSNTDAIGAKIWLYQKDSLIGYRQIGSMLNDLIVQNQNLIHFGVSENNTYNIHVLFPSGKSIRLKNISAGEQITLSEISFPLSLLYTLDNKVYSLLQNKEFISYLTVVILGFLILISCISYGIRKFDWDAQLTTLIITLNLFIFALILYTFSIYHNIFRYVMPLTIILFGSLSPIGFHLWIKNLFTKKTDKEQEFQLFQTLINFSHGSWAQSNLNSLQLLYENLSLSEIQQADYQAPFNKRKETFFNLTLPVIAEVSSELKNISSLKEMSQEIDEYKNQLSRLLEIDLSEIQHSDKELFSLNMNRLRSALSKIKKIIFSNHSCNPVTIIQNLNGELKKLKDHEQIDYRIFFSAMDPDVRVLMDPVALANILENLLQNALKAMKQTREKKLTVKLLDKETRIVIEVTDNGMGIAEDKYQAIFENGYSTTGSTGYGLYYSKKILAKYGGRIYVKESVQNKETSMVIELQKSS